MKYSQESDETPEVFVLERMGSLDFETSPQFSPLL